MTVADELKPLSLGQTPPQTSTADGPPEAPQLLSEPETPRAAVPLGAQKADPSPSPPLARPWLPCGAGSWKLVLALCAGQTPPGSPGGAAGAAWARLCPGTGCRRHGGLGCRLCSDSGESPCSRGGGGRVSHGHRHFPPPPQTPQSPAPPGGLLAHGITGNQRKPAGRQPCRTPGNPLIAQQSRADSSAPPGAPPTAALGPPPPAGPHSQKVFLMWAATSTSTSPIFFCQLAMSLDTAHHSSPCRGSAFSQRRRTSSRCSCRGARGSSDRAPPRPYLPPAPQWGPRPGPWQGAWASSWERPPRPPLGRRVKPRSPGLTGSPGCTSHGDPKTAHPPPCEPSSAADQASREVVLSSSPGRQAH